MGCNRVYYGINSIGLLKLLLVLSYLLYRKQDPCGALLVTIARHGSSFSISRALGFQEISLCARFEKVADELISGRQIEKRQTG